MGVIQSQLADRVASLLPKTSASACIAFHSSYSSFFNNACVGQKAWVVCRGCYPHPTCYVSYCFF